MDCEVRSYGTAAKCREKPKEKFNANFSAA
jgi:hypothetical protein